MRRTAALIIALFAIAFPLLAQTDAQLFEQGKAAMEANNTDKAIDSFEKAIAKNPKNAVYHYHLGNAYGLAARTANMFSQMSLGKKVGNEFEQAVALDPNYLDARMGLMEFCLQAPSIMGGGLDKAEAQAAEIKKRDAFLGHRAYARLYNFQKKPDLARNEWLGAVKAEPNNPKMHYGLAGFYVNIDKNYPLAMAEAEATVRLDPGYMPGWFRIGQVAAMSGQNLPRGEESMKKYLAYKPKENEPGAIDTNYIMGLIYEKEGRKPEALARYQAALKLVPGSKMFADAVKRVGG